MISDLNLSSRPFHNRTLPWAVIAVVALASFVSLGLILVETRRIQAQADLADRNLHDLRRRVEEVQAQSKQIEEALPQDELEVLQAAHQLIDRKRFSWSRLFADLEEAVPANVHVARISVRDVLQRGQQTYSELDMTVVGRAPSDVTSMIVEMDRAGIFQAQPVAQAQQPEKGEGGTKMELRVLYKPRAGVPAAKHNSAAIASASSAVGNGDEP